MQGGHEQQMIFAELHQCFGEFPPSLRLMAKDKEVERLAFRLVPDGYEDGVDQMWTIESDPIGTLRGETRFARQSLGARARAAPDRDAIWDEVMDLALSAPRTRARATVDGVFQP